jgi:type I restriction enzyme, S subunit
MKDLPIGWRTLTLGEIATWGSGGTPQAGNSRYYGGQIPWAIIGDLTDSDVFTTEKHITEEGLANSSAKLVPAGAILIAMYGSIGKMGIAKVPMATNQAIAFALPKPDLIDAKYLFWYLRSQRDVFLASGKGATQQNISQTLLKSWVIPVPPLDEQRRLVEVLDDLLFRLDKALAEISHSERLAKSLLASAMSSSFENVTAPKATIGEFAQVKGGKRLPKGTPWNPTPTSHPYIRSTDIKKGLIDESRLVYVPDSVWSSISRYTVDEGDVLVTIAGTIGETGVVSRNLQGANLTENAAKIVAPRELVDPHFLEMYLRSPLVSQEMQFLARATTQPKLALYRIEEIQVPLPTLGEQHEILQRLHRVQAAHRISSQRFEGLRLGISELRRSLLHSAFEGNLLKVGKDD